MSRQTLNRGDNSRRKNVNLYISTPYNKETKNYRWVILIIYQTGILLNRMKIKYWYVPVDIRNYDAGKCRQGEIIQIKQNVNLCASM